MLCLNPDLAEKSAMAMASWICNYSTEYHANMYGNIFHRPLRTDRWTNQVRCQHCSVVHAMLLLLTLVDWLTEVRSDSLVLVEMSYCTEPSLLLRLQQQYQLVMRATSSEACQKHWHSCLLVDWRWPTGSSSLLAFFPTSNITNHNRTA